MRKLLLHLGLISTLTLVACGNGDTADTGGEEAANDPAETEESPQVSDDDQVEIRFAWWGDTDRNALYEEIIDRFEEQNPNIRVMREFGGWNDYWTRLTTQVGGGNAPDVVSMHQSYVSDYANRGALLELDSYVEEGLIDQSLVEDSVTDSGRVGDELYMIAKGVTLPAYVYNPALFEEHGVETPGEDWTYDDLERIARDFVEATGGAIRGTADYSGGQLQPNFAYYVRQNGQELFTDEGNIGFDVDTLASWWGMWHSWREDGLIPDAASASEYANATLEENFFATGQTALTQVPANQLHLYQNIFEDELAIIPMPSIENGEAGEVVEGAFLSIAESSNHPEEAAQFIDFFVNTEESLELFLVEQGAPANSEMAEFITPLLDDTNAKTVEFLNGVLPRAQQAAFPPEGISELENVFAETAEAVAFGQMTAEQAAEDFMNRAQELGFVE